MTVETGCLLAARIATSRRIFINPDWTAWEWMRRMLGEEQEKTEQRGDREGPMFSYTINQNEINTARNMGARYSINRGSELSAGWFTPDEIESEPYLDYVRRIAESGNQIAIAVKLNDLHHNLERGRKMGYQRLVDKHEAALRILCPKK